jgi:hypothetical protein
MGWTLGIGLVNGLALVALGLAEQHQRNTENYSTAGPWYAIIAMPIEHCPWETERILNLQVQSANPVRLCSVFRPEEFTFKTSVNQQQCHRRQELLASTPTVLDGNAQGMEKAEGKTSPRACHKTLLLHARI